MNYSDWFFTIKFQPKKSNYGPRHGIPQYLSLDRVLEYDPETQISKQCNNANSSKSEPYRFCGLGNASPKN